MRIIVTGCRDWTDRARVFEALDSFIGRPKKTTIVHGACPTGVDAIVDEFCIESGITVERHPADWNLHGKVAGPLRNAEMAARGADICIAFWDGKSPGTSNMIKCAVEHGIPVRIVAKRGRP